MRCLMRSLNVALNLVASAVPIAAVAFISCAPASAHAHHHSYRHVYASATYSSQYFAASSAIGQSDFIGNGTARSASYDNVSAVAASQASAASLSTDLPASLVERVIRRETGGNPRAVHAGNYGLMQIRLGTARAMGYSGSAAGLLDPQTNMIYALRYLAGAYRAAGGNESRAIALYSRGYYYQAKAQGFSPYGFSPYASRASGG